MPLAIQGRGLTSQAQAAVAKAPCDATDFAKYSDYYADKEAMVASFSIVPPSSPAREIVVTVPGLLAGRNSMRQLDGCLRSAGYHSEHWPYPSLRGSITRHAARLSDDLSAVARSNEYRRIHLITHSMGSVIARAAILQSRLETRWPALIGRIVMLAPPNGGSRLTRIPLGPFASSFPQLCELSESPDSYVRRLPPLEQMPVGVIAATKDFVVAQPSTHLVNQRDHAVLPTTHQRLISHPDAIAMSIRFLQTERFADAPIDGSHRDDQRRRVQSAAA
ncbi:alpha/beta hydrolase [Allorhodopirellula solitaria]|uniref:Alpha/beta hydrolase family protein n=1 Tax=Allorhodopirellula solitaria TaxID=2527987 RepID=A0A5C5YJJ9_9BACT|nr:alpha/beta hydrolase [Allorhodopirellula solitaria]TWT75018.1 Alpha/beta hydrolase family protein [Allorhodopirellula solitaria]